VIRSLLRRSGCSTNSSGRSGNGSRVTGFIPVLDVRETEDDYVVMVDLPQVKEPKTERSRRRVPVRARVVEAIRAQPPRLDTPLVFPAPRGGHIDGEKFRSRHWAPALCAAGLEHRRVYDARHTFASWAIADGVHLFELSRVMGTSVEQLDAVYGHLMPSWEDRVREQLDAGDEQRAARVGS
jgi:integrase